MRWPGHRLAPSVRRAARGGCPEESRPGPRGTRKNRDLGAGPHSRRLDRRRLRRLRELGERRGVAHREVGEQLAVHLDVRALESGDQAAVREPVDARGGIDARDPQTAEVTLLRATVLVRELAGTLHRLQRRLEQLAPSTVVALGGFEDLAPPGAAGDDGFGAWHRSSPARACRSWDRPAGYGDVGAVSACRAAAACGP